jgi:hypothetical protein
MRRRVRVALANCSRVQVVGLTLPLSRSAIAACVVPIAAATCPLGHARISARLDQRGGEGELLVERFISSDEVRVFPPLLRGRLYRNGSVSSNLLCPAQGYTNPARRFVRLLRKHMHHDDPRATAALLYRPNPIRDRLELANPH